MRCVTPRITAQCSAVYLTDSSNGHTRGTCDVIEVGVLVQRSSECSGQVKTDTQLSNQSELFIFIGTNIPEIRMLPSAIVEHLDVINDIVPCLLTRGVITMRCPLAF